MTPIMSTHFHCGQDLFSPEALENPYPLYRELRDIGPAAYLAKHDVWFIGRYKPVRDALFDPQLVTRAANEIIRMESPIQLFSRVTTRDVDLGEGIVIPTDTRVIVGYGCANRDERRFIAPDQFDLRRSELDHVGFGHGAHGCAGQGLARLEIHAVLKALAQWVRCFEISGAAERAVNNVTRGFRRLPVSVERRLTG